MANNKELDYFFHPKSMAVIGASEVLNSYGARYIQALLDIGFKGKLYAVNHSGEEVLGHKIFRKITDVPDPVELVSICVAARFIPNILRECLEKGVKAAIVLSAGFSESGEEGLALEREIVEIASRGIRVMGPNCFGTYCPSGRITIVPGGSFPKQSGGVALITQSGQLSEGITARSFGEGIRYSMVASYGNACNINEADLLEFLMDDEETKVFTSYIEGVREGHRFFEIARNNSGKKPIILWKVGLTQSGAAAASSHTGSLAGGNTVWDTFFRQTHAIQARSMEESIETSAGFLCLPEGCGLNTALISGGGAGTVIGADACENAGMKMPAFKQETLIKLRELLPAIGTSINNPLDIGNPHPPLGLFRSLLEAVAADDNIDVIIIRRIFFSIKVSKIFSGTTAPSYEEQQELLEIPVNLKKKFNKPVVIILPEELTSVETIDIEEERRKIRDYFFSHGIPVYLTEQKTFTALGNLAKFNQRIGKKIVFETNKYSLSKARKKVLETIKKSNTAVLDEMQCKSIVKDAGIKVTMPILASTQKEAVAASNKLGYPVVMKIISPQITHKSDIGGVKLGLHNASDVKKAYDGIMSAVKKKAPKAVIDGVSIQKTAKKGMELVIGMTKDPQFGAMLMFGVGGTLVEIIKDISFRCVPLTREDAGDMIRQIKAYRLFEGYRGQPAVDIKYMEELLMRLSAFIEQNPEIKEMDINPLFAYNKGAVAVDARIILEEGIINK